MNWFVFAMFALTAPLAAQAAVSPILSLSVHEPRSFGYFVGDVFRREVDIIVAEPYRLEKASQPVPGRIAYWLDLRTVDVVEAASSGQRHYRLSLDYQTFYVPLSPATLTIPGSTLRFSDGEDTAIAKVPPFTFVMAPLREVQPEQPESGPAGYLRPDAVPGKIGTLNERLGFAAGAALTLIALALLAYHQAWWPFHRRPERPFTRAARTIKSRLARGEDTDTYRDGLLELHRAFDVAAGHRLLAEDVPVFLTAHGEFQPLEKDITRFFANSRIAFFGNDMERARKFMPLEAVAALGDDLGEAERRAA